MNERSPKIEYSWMTGDERRSLVIERLLRPTGLTVDYYKNHRIFWCDSKLNVIESVNYDGSDRAMVARSGKIIMYYNSVHSMPGFDFVSFISSALALSRMKEQHIFPQRSLVDEERMMSVRGLTHLDQCSSYIQCFHIVVQLIKGHLNCNKDSVPEQWRQETDENQMT